MGAKLKVVDEAAGRTLQRPGVATRREICYESRHV
jgi:hypothetical protein